MMVPFSRNDNPGGFTDEQLRAAAKAVRSAMLESLKTEAEEQHSFSESFLRRLQALLRINDRRERRKHALQRAAIILIGFFLAGTLFLAFNPDARADFSRWIKEAYEKSIFYQFFSKGKYESDPASPAQVLPDIEFSWLPGEYESQKVYDDGQHIILLLSNPEDTIVLEYMFVSCSEYVEVFTKDYVQEKAVVQGGDADFYQSISEGVVSVLIWKDDSESIIFKLNSGFSKEIIIQIAEGIDIN